MRAHDRSGATVELRPGVFRPDWRVVRTDTVREALGAKGAGRASLVQRWLTPLSVEEDRVWRGVLTFFVDNGRAPRFADIAAATGLAEDRVRGVLKALRHRDLLGVDAEAGAVTYAYPFAGRRTGHTVQVGGHALDSLCAVDALGTGAMCDADVTVVSKCRSCGGDIRIETADQGRALRSITPPGAVIWYDLSFGDNAATSCCSNTAFFCSDAHLGAWQQAGGRRNGHRLTIEEGLEMGRAVFGPLLADARDPVNETERETA